MLVEKSENWTLCDDNLFYLRPFADLLTVLSCAVNFVIYVVFKKRFRHELARTVGCCRVTEVDGRRLPSTVRSPRVSVVSGVTAGQKNDTAVACKQHAFEARSQKGVVVFPERGQWKSKSSG